MLISAGYREISRIKFIEFMLEIRSGDNKFCGKMVKIVGCGGDCKEMNVEPIT